MQLALMVATAAEDERAVAALTEMMSMVTGGMTDEEVEECRTQALELYDAATDDED
jgi:hypothetical protein